MQLGQLRVSLDALNEQSAKVLAIDPHESWSAKYLLKDAGASTDELHFPMLMDPAQTVSATYGVAFQMRIHVEHSNRPATFVIDKEGIVRYARRAKTFGDRPRPKDVLEILKGLEKK